jgi:prepilin-type N-terminal cleavage/methylation domain-containing protein
MKNENGFTLIEIIISLVIVGIMASIVGILMVLGVQEYAFSKENIAVSQKASLALKRIEKEIRGLTAMDEIHSNDSCIRYKIETLSPYYRAIGIRGNSIELKIVPDSDCDCATNGDVLADQVSSLILSYESSASDPSTVSSSPPLKLQDLSEVRVLFTLNLRSGEVSKSFEVRINPRNNGNLNGPGAQL